MTQTPNIRPPTQVFWALWFGILVSMTFYQFKLGGGVPLGSNRDSALPPLGIEVIAGLQFFAAAATRWLIVPRIRVRRKLLIALVVGLALSEGIGIFGIFLVPAGYPQTKLVFMSASYLSILQFIPIFVSPAEEISSPLDVG